MTHRSVIECLQPQSQNWDDFRYFLSAVERGSFAAAARHLNVSKPTVRRRIAQLEERLGLLLFTQRPDGQAITRAGKVLAASVAKVRGEVEQLQRYAIGLQPEQSHVIKLTTTDGLAHCWLAETLADFQQLYPNMRIHVLASSERCNLSNNDADIAVRIGDPGSNELVGRRLGDIEFGLFASSEYLNRYGVPTTMGDLTKHKLIGSLDSVNRIHANPHLAQLLEPRSIGIASNSLSAQLEFVRCGAGIACLPSYLEHKCIANGSKFVQVLEGIFEHKMDLWLLAHKEIAQLKGTRLVLDYLHDRYRKEFGSSTLRKIT